MDIVAGTIKRAKELGRVGRGFLIARPCKGCGIIRWQQINAKPTLCRKCAATISRMQVLGDKSPTWKGGRQTLKSGYILVVIPKDSPYAVMSNKSDRGQPRVFEHRLVMAKHLGRPLESWELVHHKNGIRDDNRLENLELLPNPSIHYSSTRVVEEIKTLTKTVEELSKLVNLLFMSITFNYGNPELNSRNETLDKCVETMCSASSEEDEEIVHPSMKIEE